MQIKAISLWQPWASLMAIQAKQYETRHWTVKYRGPIAIHAAKRWTNEEKLITRSTWFYEALKAGGLDAMNMPLGGIVAVGELTAIYRTELLFPKISEQERAFGNYQAGRFAWRIENVRQVAFVPVIGRQVAFVPVIGRQGLFEVELRSDWMVA
jgi:hypothetical protein